MVHALAALFLLTLHRQGSNSLQAVEMDVLPMEEKAVVEPPPTPPQPVPQPDRIKPPARPSPPRREPVETPSINDNTPPLEAEPPAAIPAVFDIADDSFAQAGQAPAFAMAPSEGNTHIGKVASPAGTSVRGTTPTGTAATANATSPDFSPEPRANWSRRPEPRAGTAPLPPYPPEARREGIEGKVRLRVFIGRDGRVRRVEILSDPGAGLGDAAKRAMQDQLWLPALGQSGKPVDAVIVYTYNFVLR
jgi:protein TonB